MINEYMEYYQRNKQLDKMYEDKYSNIDSKYFEKNCLELIVELCELANESKCFKYWTIKEADKGLVLEEYADCISMLLCIFNHYEVDEIKIIDRELNDDVVIIFNDVIRMCTMLMNEDIVTDELLYEIFTYLLHIGKLLNLDDREILDVCYMKLGKNIERLNSDY